ncbi:MAG TPA: SBBP repeat-containing protein [Verrucomicrobiae bacterium]|nr:SBBP repeat-containing protein [Verrucomicrobiae bacterium]
MKTNLAFGTVALTGLNAAATLATMSRANLPLYFEANRGQTGSSAPFIAHGNRSEFLVFPDAAELVLGKSAGTHSFSSRVVQLRFVGADSQAKISGVDELSGKINYLIGNNPSKWETGVPTFAKVRVTNLYPGVNLAYYGNGREIEYDFTLAPGADPNLMAIHFDGVSQITINANGDLALNVGDGQICQPGPVIYQVVQGMRKEIRGGFKLLDAHTIGFSVGTYDRTVPLVIDPILSYSTYFGGNGNDAAAALAVDTNGFVYIAGQTTSTAVPPGKPFATPGAFQTTYPGGLFTAFVAKFDNLGTNLIYLTYLGGDVNDYASAIAVDGPGNVYVTGETESPNFPVTTNAPFRHIGGTSAPTTGYPIDAFVTKLASGGSNLVFSTFLGGSASDAANGIALDSADNVYVTGFTFSTNFPVTTNNAFQTQSAFTNWNYQPEYDANAFVTEIGASGTNLLYSSYFGGNYFDFGEAIAVDESNYIYITGYTLSTNFPVKNAIMQTIGTNFVNGNLLNGRTNQFPFFGYDAYVAKFAPGFSNLIYSTYLGGGDDDAGYAVAADGAGNAYVAGWTDSTNFPVTVTNLPPIQNGLTNNVVYGFLITNAFVVQIVWNGSNAAIGHSVVFGGTNEFSTDIANGLALDASGNIFVDGSTSSTNFPAVDTGPDFLAATNAGQDDAFVIAFSTNFSSVMYSGSLGGAADDSAYAIAVDPADNAYIAGQTYSANFPTNNARQTVLNGAANTFLAKLILNTNPPPLSISANSGLDQVAWRSGMPFEPEISRLYALESNTNLLSTNWTAVSPAPILSNNWYSVVFNPTNSAGFFRLEAVHP